MRTITITATIVAAVVMLTWAMPASGAGGGGYSLTLVGSYTPEGMTTPVDVYKVTLHNYNPGGVIGAIDMCVGNHDMYGNPIFPNIYAPGTGDGSDPFQAWVNGGVGTMPTPSPETAILLGTDTNAYRADTHFLIPSSWMPAAFPQGESNDLSGGDGLPGVKYGLGSIGLITAVPITERSNAIDVIQVGVPHGTIVYADLGLWDGLGREILEKYYTGGDKYRIDGGPMVIPEPLTGALLAVGVFVALRRRR